MSIETAVKAGGKLKLQKESWIAKLAKSWQLWVIIAPSVIYLLIFRYYPMYGAILAFKDYDPTAGIMGSRWVGLMHFTGFLESYIFIRVLSNTLLISLYSLVFGFPFPILLALMLNSTNTLRFKKSVQMVRACQ